MRPQTLEEPNNEALGKTGLRRLSCAVAISHVAAFSMNDRGRVTELFTTHGWVTSEDVLGAEGLIAALPRGGVDHSQPCLAVNHGSPLRFAFSPSRTRH